MLFIYGWVNMMHHQNYVWCDPHIRPAHWAVWCGGLGRSGSAGVVC